MHSFESKEGGQSPNFENTDSQGIGVDVVVAEVGLELEEVQMMLAVVGGMAGKKPYPKFNLFFTSSSN